MRKWLLNENVPPLEKWDILLECMGSVSRKLFWVPWYISFDEGCIRCWLITILPSEYKINTLLTYRKTRKFYESLCK